MVLVDARDLDPAEGVYLATSRVRRRAVAEIQAEDLPGGPVILHLDVDVIDPTEVPGLRFPAPGGPSRSTVLDAVRRLVSTGRVSILTWRARGSNPLTTISNRSAAPFWPNFSAAGRLTNLRYSALMAS